MAIVNKTVFIFNAPSLSFSDRQPARYTFVLTSAQYSRRILQPGLETRQYYRRRDRRKSPIIHKNQSELSAIDASVDDQTIRFHDFPASSLWSVFQERLRHCDRNPPGVKTPHMPLAFRHDRSCALLQNGFLKHALEYRGQGSKKLRLFSLFLCE